MTLASRPSTLIPDALSSRGATSEASHGSRGQGRGPAGKRLVDEAVRLNIGRFARMRQACGDQAVYLMSRHNLPGIRPVEPGVSVDLDEHAARAMLFAIESRAGSLPFAPGANRLRQEEDR